MEQASERSDVGKLPEPLKVAHRYGELGYLVFPCHWIEGGTCSCGKEGCESPGKHPLTSHGVKNATRDPQQIEKWWQQYEKANIAVATGRGSGAVVLDVDKGSWGYRSLKRLEEKHGPLPETPVAKTGGGGRHYWFSYAEVRNAVGVQPGLDIRSDGGYVIVPYSNHISGGKYEWEDGKTLSAIGLADLPKYLYPDRSDKQSSSEKIDPKSVLKGVSKGKRDDTLFRYACRLRAQGIKKEEMQVLILKAAADCKPAFSEKAAKKKVEQAMQYSPPIAAMLMEIVRNPPRVQSSETMSRITWGSKQGIMAEVTSLKEHSNGDITGFVTWTTTMPAMPERLHQAKFNFATTRSRSHLANLLVARAPALNKEGWLSVIESMCNAVIDQVKEGEPAATITDDDEIKPVGQLVRPFLLEEEPVIFYGGGGSTKSYLAQMFAHMLVLGKGTQVAGLAPERKMRVLYLDWEANRDELARRFKMLGKGLGLARGEMTYRLCSRSLAADIEQIRNVTMEKEIEFVVIDSLGPACGGDLNTPQPAIEFFSALRSLHVSSLLIAHVAKNTQGPTTPYGSAFFGFLARSIWEVVPHQEPGDKDVMVGLYHRKSNSGGLEKPRGYRFVFEDGSVKFERADLEMMPEAGERASLSTRICKVLLEMGKLTTAEVANELGSSQASTRVTLNRLRDKKKVMKLSNHKWGVKVKDELV